MWMEDAAIFSEGTAGVKSWRDWVSTLGLIVKFLNSDDNGFNPFGPSVSHIRRLTFCPSRVRGGEGGFCASVCSRGALMFFLLNFSAHRLHNIFSYSNSNRDLSAFDARMGLSRRGRVH